ncbi:MAG: RNA-binding protein [Candidatus Wallbacteria bacterium HGW-Wallbacteria-1]|jgi:ribosomal 50S subunit-recycling heat shock protein|uniref:RQC P-site tRNA stabilizing factor n=1 Tax=Candidatus Wallbacteria bacterium HGW-Wallbacteria-1 TaxID=2013854 RepID=A0A2N1PLV7_9BACT|nr:MAG: RNA-binding protein [Candidatus Wallbacteria bacterium HGW-Wallbacteria-1]
MRLDKFLKVSRLSKRRTMARDLCHNELVFINGTRAKPSRDVHVDDIMEISVRERTIKVRVLAVPERAVGKDMAASLYEVIEIRENPPLDHSDDFECDDSEDVMGSDNAAIPVNGPAPEDL